MVRAYINKTTILVAGGASEEAAYLSRHLVACRGLVVEKQTAEANGATAASRRQPRVGGRGLWGSS